MEIVGEVFEYPEGVYLGFPVKSKYQKLIQGPQYLILDGENVHMGLDSLLYPGAVIYENVEIGDNFFLGHYAIIRENVKIGNDCKIGPFTIVQNNAKMGNDVNIQTQCNIAEYMEIGNHVFIAGNTEIQGDRYPIRPKSSKPEPPKIEDYVIIGGNVTISPAITIHSRVVVGAGSVVTKDLDSGFVYVGNPAKELCSIEKYCEKHLEFYGKFGSWTEKLLEVK